MKTIIIVSLVFMINNAAGEERRNYGAKSLDVFIEHANQDYLFGNGSCLPLESDLSLDPDKLLKKYFASASYTQGKPKSWKILESKVGYISQRKYFFIRAFIFGKDDIFHVDLEHLCMS